MNMPAQELLVRFVNENGIQREDILSIVSNGNIETLYYYA
jgi:hypothetical protein